MTGIGTGTRLAWAWCRDRSDALDGDSNAGTLKEFLNLRRELTSELNITSSKKVSHNVELIVMRRQIPDASLVSVLSAEDLEVPEEFVLVEFKNPDTRCVVGHRMKSNNEDGQKSSTLSVFESDRNKVVEFIASSGARFHRAARRFIVSGDAFVSGDFIIRICRVESGSGSYVGTLLDLTYKASDNITVAIKAMEEYVAYASMVATSRCGKGSFLRGDLQLTYPRAVYRPNTALQLAVSYVDAMRSFSETLHQNNIVT
jgi:hypothetical protein